ncbi:MAG: dTMP kinase [Planctomycetaceae bacterium]|nr:dTMP kinase [Planctomycetaceae bacterium]
MERSDNVLVAIEGIDGSGKGTQARRLTQTLSDQGRRVELLSFPRYDDTFFGRTVGRFLNGEFGSLSEANPFLVSLLFAGDRFESRELLREKMESNDLVILDRYVASNIAHQGSKLPVEQQPSLIEFVQTLEYEIYGLPRATLNVLLDLPAETAQELIGRKNARSYTEQSHDLQEADRDYLESVRQTYLTVAERHPDSWRIISAQNENGLRSIESIGEELLTLVLQAADS